MSVNWRLFRCTRCLSKGEIGFTAVIKHWGFDEKGDLYLSGFCVKCGNNFTVKHSFDEQRADSREMFVEWCQETEAEPRDFKLWEWELREEEE